MEEPENPPISLILRYSTRGQTVRFSYVTGLRVEGNAYIM
jgi:hypothetical protein